MTQSFPQHTTSLGQGEEALVKQARASVPHSLVGSTRCVAVRTRPKYLERLTVCSIESLTWQKHGPPA